MYVATNRQKKNAFEKRAEMQRKAAEPAPKAAPRTTPTPVAEPKPDLEAMKAAAAEAAALVHAAAPEPTTLDTFIAEIDPGSVEGSREDSMVPEYVSEPEPKRGRPMSAAVAKRNATILQLLAENPEGLSKTQLASELKEKEANVYTSLRRLQSDGKVMVDSSGGGSYRWFITGLGG
jgi:hypothetical protein